MNLHFFRFSFNKGSWNYLECPFCKKRKAKKNSLSELNDPAAMWWVQRKPDPKKLSIKVGGRINYEA
jgi:hypothetical protein